MAAWDIQETEKTQMKLISDELNSICEKIHSVNNFMTQEYETSVDKGGDEKYEVKNTAEVLQTLTELSKMFTDVNVEETEKNHMKLISDEINGIHNKIDTYLLRQFKKPVVEGGDNKYEVKNTAEVLKTLTEISKKCANLTRNGCENVQNYTCLNKKEIFYLVYHYPDESWNHFMSILSLRDEDRDNCIRKAKGNVQEARYQMFAKWLQGVKEERKLMVEIKNALHIVKLEEFADMFEKVCNDNGNIVRYTDRHTVS